MRWITTLAVTSSIFTSAVTATPAIEREPWVPLQTEITTSDWVPGDGISPDLAIYSSDEVILTSKMNAWGKEQLARQAAEDHTARIESMMQSVEDRIGKTWYVFGGASPAGWDCSGLTRWAYARLGVELPHSASAQLRMGTVVTEPQRGDLVVFGRGYHVGLYYSPGVMLHSGGRPGQRTQLRDISDFWGKVTYVRIINAP